MSTSIRGLGHDPATSVLEVEFRRGAVYRYFGVPRSVYETVRAAASVGATFNALVRDRYPAERV